VSAYDKLFDVIKGILLNYHVCVEVGRYEGLSMRDNKLVDVSEAIELYPIGLRVHDVEASVKDTIYMLHKPRVILRNLISSLTSAAKVNQDKIKELEFALRLVKALSEDDEKRGKS
jgi:hypothetical protein